MPTGRNECFAAFIDGTLYAFGGYDKFSMIASDSWYLFDGLVAYYPFNGNANDESGNGNDGVVEGATPFSNRIGELGTALRFDGVDDRVIVNNFEPSLFTELTISAHFFLESLGDDVDFILSGGESTYEIHTGGSSGRNGIRFIPVSHPAFTDTKENVFQSSKWVHVITVYDPAKTRSEVWIDGKKMAVTISSEEYPPLSTLSTLMIGDRIWQHRIPFEGVIDDIRLFNRALSSQEIQELFRLEDELTMGLVAHYPFNGNANDESGTGNHATEVTAVPITDRFGNSNSAYAFDGNSSLITVPDSPSLRIPGDITVACWVNLVSTPSRGTRLVGKGIGCGKNYGLWLDKPDQRLFWMFQQFPPEGGCIGCQENTASSIPGVTLGKWYHVVGVRSGNVSRLYVDGILLGDADGQAENCSPTTYTGSEPLRMGEPGEPLASNMHGSLDDIRIYNRALSSAQVLELYEVERGFCSPRAATALAIVVNGFLVDVQVMDPGCGYEEPPFVRIVGGGGSGAVIEPVVRDGQVQDFIVSDAGRDYTKVPVILIASPPFAPSLAIAVSKVRVSLSVVLGRTYQLESSGDLAAWNAVGEPFVALEEEIEQEFDVAETGRFFRILEVP